VRDFSKSLDVTCLDQFALALPTAFQNEPDTNYIESSLSSQTARLVCLSRAK